MRNTITIAIDGNEANVEKRVGSNVYAFEILVELEKLTAVKKNISCVILLSQPPVANLPKERVGWQYKVLTPTFLWTQWALPLHLFIHKHAYSILFTPGHYAPRFSPIPYVSSVMDLAFLTYPHHFKKEDYIKLKAWTSYSVKYAKKVIAISQYTKHEVIKKYHKNEADVVVAYPAVQVMNYKISARTLDSVLKKFSITNPYLLFVGTIQPRKNLDAILQAFETIIQKKKLPFKPNLVLAGKTGWLAEPILKKIEASSSRKYIKITNFITEREKAALYKGATASTLLGLHEGFGIPPLESLHHGTLPIVSNTTSLPEVVGPAGVTVDPTNQKEIVQAFVSAFTLSAKKRAEYRKHARDQIKKFDWQASARIILDTLLKAAQ